MNAPLFSSFLLFTKRILLLIVFYQLIRLGFYFYNASFFPDVNFMTFWGGLRFDLSVIGYANLIFALLHLIPGKFQENKKYQSFLFYSFFIVNAFILSLNFIDFEYFRFIGRRSSFGMITASGMENEIFGLIQSYMIDYWQIPLFAVLFLFLFGWALKKVNYKNIQSKFSLLGLGICILGIGILFVMGRGLERKPIRIVDASKYGSINNSALVLNTPFSVLKTIGKKESLEITEFFSPEEANAIFNPIQEFSHDVPNKKNVVLIILESFGRENIQRGQTPFLDSLITKSYFFENGFANGKLSIDAVPSTITSIPSLMNISYITSSYSLNKVNGLPIILKNEGYSTSFFHGAFNGSQNFDQFASVAGFDNYFGKNEYEGPESFDGKWGVFDEEFFQYFNTKLSTFQEPFFSTLFTVSSHAPFTIPEKYKGKFPKGTTEIHESVAYTDYALKEFFKSAQKEPWYSNTIFVFTADHTSSSGQEPEWKNNVGKFRIPIFFFAPGDDTMVGISDKNFQQIDILPSLMDYLQLNGKILSYGKSYKSDKDFTISYLDNIYNYEKGDYYLAFDGKKAIALFNWKKDPLLKENLISIAPEIAAEMEQFIKAYVQSFNTRVIHNQLTIEN